MAEVLIPWILILGSQLGVVALVVWFAVTFARMRRDQVELLRVVSSIEERLRAGQLPPA